jgi:hypothetical protein
METSGNNNKLVLSPEGSQSKLFFANIQTQLNRTSKAASNSKNENDPNDLNNKKKIVISKDKVAYSDKVSVYMSPVLSSTQRLNELLKLNPQA